MRNKVIKIDRQGRIALPVSVRKRLDLKPGDELKLTEYDAGIQLEPQPAAGHLVRKGSMLVFTREFNEPVTTETIQRLIQKDRDQLSKNIKLRRK